MADTDQNQWPGGEGQVPQQPVPAVPQPAVPQAAVPQSAVPQAAVPQAAVPQAAVPPAAVPQSAVPPAAVMAEPQVPVQPHPPTWLEKNIPTLAKVLQYFKKKTALSPPAVATLQQPEAKAEQRDFMKNWYTILVSKKDRLLFLDQVTTLLNSDIRIVDGLRLIKQQTSKWAFKKLLVNMLADVEGGKQLSDSMLKYPAVFPLMWVNLIRAGEASGKLAQIMKDLNKQQTDLEHLLGNIKGALVYPGFIIGMLVVLMTVMMTTIVPQIEGIYQQARVDLPYMTRVIIAISRFMIANGPLMGVVIVVAIIGFILAVKKVYFVRKMWDYINLRWPVFGELNRERNLIIFADNLQLLLSSGVLVADALKITAQIVPSLNYNEEVMRMKDEITRGSTMSKSMGLIDISREVFKRNFYFPMEFAQMINVGEQTGNLISVLNKVKETYADKVQHTVKNLSTLLEPIMIVIVGVLVGIFLLGIMLPFFGLGKVARGL